MRVSNSRWKISAAYLPETTLPCLAFFEMSRLFIKSKSVLQESLSVVLAPLVPHFQFGGCRHAHGSSKGSQVGKGRVDAKIVFQINRGPRVATTSWTDPPIIILGLASNRRDQDATQVGRCRRCWGCNAPINIVVVVVHTNSFRISIRSG